MTDRVLVDATTLAHQIGQAKSSVYRLAKCGVIPFYAAGPKLRGLRFDVAEVKEVLWREGNGGVPARGKDE